MGKPSLDRIVFVPEEELLRRKDGEVICDSWWLYVEGKGFGFFDMGGREYSPQCNVDERISRKFWEFEGTEVRFVGAAYLGYRDGSYMVRKHGRV